jgi:hypothetical protein
VTETLGPKKALQEKDLWDVSMNILEEMMPRINDNITEIENEVQGIIDDYITYSLEQVIPKEVYQQKCIQLTRMIASQLYASLQTMYERSIAHFDQLIQFLTLGLTIPNMETKELEHLYSRSIYVDRYKAMLAHNLVPNGLTACLHPAHLRTQARLTRSLEKVRLMVTHLSKQAHGSNLY